MFGGCLHSLFLTHLENYNLCLLCAAITKREGSDPHSPVVRTCHPGPLSSPSENNFQSPRQRPCNFSQTLLPAVVIPLPLCMVVSTSITLQHAGQYQPLIHTCRFCENMWLDRDFMPSSFHWAESGSPLLATGKSTWESVFSLPPTYSC